MTEPQPAAAEPSPQLRLFADATAIRRGRFLALFLLVNWAVLGVYVLSQGLRSLVGGLAFGLGLFSLAGGLSHLRASRRAPLLPLVEVEGDRLLYRRYSATEPTALALDTVETVVSRSRDSVVVRTTDGSLVTVPCLALAPADRSRLADLLEQRAAG